MKILNDFWKQKALSDIEQIEKLNKKEAAINTIDCLKQELKMAEGELRRIEREEPLGFKEIHKELINIFDACLNTPDAHVIANMVDKLAYRIKTNNKI